MKIPLHQLDAFTSRPFHGNPAAVCPLEHWLEDDVLQAVAAENNLPATAFFVRNGDDFGLRWFTPVREIRLCGHATLASAYVILNRLDPGRAQVRFETFSGDLLVSRDGPRLQLDLPAISRGNRLDPALVAEAIGVEPRELWESDRTMAVLDTAENVRDLRPDIGRIAALPFDGLVVTARGFEHDCDFVSRYFAPTYGIPEDSVTGSAHCVLTPYWAGVLGKDALFARQLSARGGEIWVVDHGERVLLSGNCVPIVEDAFLNV
jgi:predicted PhzF superfamily epimerase YddE/YHI9